MGVTRQFLMFALNILLIFETSLAWEKPESVTSGAATGVVKQWPLRHDQKIQQLATKLRLDLKRADNIIQSTKATTTSQQLLDHYHAFSDLRRVYSEAQDEIKVGLIDKEHLDYLNGVIESTPDKTELAFYARGEILRVMDDNIDERENAYRIKVKWGFDDFTVFRKYQMTNVANAFIEYLRYLEQRSGNGQIFTVTDPELAIKFGQKELEEIRSCEKKYLEIKTLPETGVNIPSKALLRKRCKTHTVSAYCQIGDGYALKHSILQALSAYRKALEAIDMMTEFPDQQLLAQKKSFISQKIKNLEAQSGTR